MFKNRAISGLLLIAFVLVSYFVLIRFVTPLIVDTTSSDIYIDQADNYVNEAPDSKVMTDAAIAFCLNELAAEHDEIANIDLSKLANTAWPLEGYHYIVKTKFPPNQSPDNQPHIMVCEITYDQASQAPDSADNWNVIGLSFTIPDNVN